MIKRRRSLPIRTRPINRASGKNRAAMPMIWRSSCHTASGTCGIKVWIFKGEILEHDPMAQDKRAETQDTRSQGRRAPDMA